jgi:RNA polymerase sigma factor (sigma-70 family)
MGREQVMWVAEVSESHRSFERAFDLHGPAILRFASRRVSSPASAQDVVSEAFLAAWRHWDRRPADPASQLPWLYQFAASVLRNVYRAEARTIRLSLRVADDARTGATTANPAVSIAEMSALSDAMSRVSAADREVLQLLAWEKVQNAEELGLALGISTSTARVRMHRARRRLKQHLHEQDEPLTAAQSDEKSSKEAEDA